MTDTMSFEGRTVLVTGSSTGIGRAIALGFAQAGGTIIAHWHSAPDAAKELVEEIGADRCRLVEADLTDVAAIRDMYRQVDGFSRGLDILVNNAATTGWTPDILQVSEDQWDAIMDTNLKGSFFSSIEAARRMRASGGGSIVNVSSNLAALAVPQLAIYGVSKGGINALTAHMSVELAPYGIRVNALAPGPTVVARTLRDDPDYRITWAGLVPLGRAAEANDMVGPALFLASDAARFVTGQVLYADGGWTKAGRTPSAQDIRKRAD
jgi:3-oxoacyl-[acyl-carrier protein] reductase